VSSIPEANTVFEGQEIRHRDRERWEDRQRNIEQTERER
jgi:hypothetical protein